MLATAFFVSASCTSVEIDEMALADRELGVFTRELTALRFGNNPCPKSSVCGVGVRTFDENWTRLISEAYMGNVTFSYDPSLDDQSLRGWFMLKDWAQAVGCNDFGDWVLSRGDETIQRSCDQETMFLSHYTNTLYLKLLSNGPCEYGENEDSWCGARFNSIVDGELVWMQSEVWDQPWQTVDMGEVHFQYDGDTDNDGRGQKALLRWAEIVGCANVGDWVFSADWRAAGYPPTPCSGEIASSWNGNDPRFGSQSGTR